LLPPTRPSHEAYGAAEVIVRVVANVAVLLLLAGCASRTKTATGQIDMPEHTAWQVRGCDGQWLVVDGDAAAGACGPVDGVAPSGCTAMPQVTRFFLRFRYLRWTTVANTKEGGCAKVQHNDPSFPTELCRGLASPG
jgi:hypothetical protein